MERTRCGAPTRSGGTCRWDAEKCPHEWHRAARPGKRGEHAVEVPPRLPGSDQPWWAERDLRGLGWWLIRGVLDGQVDVREAGVVSGLMRTLVHLGPDGPSLEEALAEVELRGVLMHGQPPRSPEEWELAERIFDPAALAEFRRWSAASNEQ